jgi:ribonucleoside-diphosphate reductase alpha chain
MPEESTVEDIFNAYVESWKLGLKAVAIYRDNSKVAQVLTTSEKTNNENKPAAAPADEVDAEEDDATASPRAHRHKLPDERLSLTHKFNISGHEGYITVGLYKNGMPGELFITMAKEGSTISGLVDSFATAVSISLQHGVPLQLLCKKFAHTRFEPSGWTGNEQIGYAKSLMDYIFRWLQLRFLSGTQLSLFAGLAPAVPQLETPPPGLVEPELDEEEKNHLAKLAEEVARRLSKVNALSEVGGKSHELSEVKAEAANPAPSLQDRGVYHAADAMRDLYVMGDAPSCHTCGAIMVRNGSCYRCMSCGSTSGCS